MISYAAISARCVPPPAEAPGHASASIMPFRHPASQPSLAVIAARLADLVDSLQMGIVLVDANARILFTNAAARELASDGDRLRLGNGSLSAPSDGDTKALRRAVAAALQHDDAASRGEVEGTPCRIGEPPLFALVASLAPSARRGASEAPTAAVFLVDPRRVALPSASQLRDSFGLTAAEAVLALEIMKGDGANACAMRLGISRTTARTHLKHIFEKTGTSRQTQLLRLLFTLRPPI